MPGLFLNETEDPGRDSYFGGYTILKLKLERVAPRGIIHGNPKNKKKKGATDEGNHKEEKKRNMGDR
jgi:hypothetical protein